ncbi:septum formation family protein [Corynebacterium guangdongense]|uniref:Septum formation-related domain-containing protein n=1 Tax=Corynebacterium guangdongense TaxID=1783348 RepID=A0ABU1ZZW9_9CORY|nr:hypothetical protein [Corynebacterium guangdongense]WJZ19028.1 putative membrane protein [Corynebacterium guangdongense]
MTTNSSDIPATTERPRHHTPGWRSSAAAMAVLIGALASAVGVGSYSWVAESEGAGGGSTTVASESQSTTSGGSSSQSSVSGAGDVVAGNAAPFTTAESGTCLTWQLKEEDRSVVDFERTSCDEPHRFEVSTRQDLGAYPSSEFGPEAPQPDLTRQAQLREELCETSTMRYLDGRFDPTGRYSIASILPPPEAWAAGDRTLLCGVQSTDAQGNVQETVGPISANDQARVAEPGQCMRIDGANSITVVDCAEDHQIEATSIVDLTPVFPDGVPAEEDQDRHLQETCTQAAIDYLGEEENLYQSTLQPFWLDIPASSWNGGSHSTNCGLVFATPEGFATLKGSATAGREDFTINGQPPAEQPPRDPLAGAQ